MEGSKKKRVIYAVVDAFTDRAFKGNPAAVCLLEEEREDEWLQSLAAEFNLSQTCFLISLPLSHSSIPRFQLRWFTPVTQVELCGHATLAAAYFCFTSGLVKGQVVEFSTLSGILTARKINEKKDSSSPINGSENEEVEQPFLIELDFPAIAISDYNLEDSSQLLSRHDSIVDVKKTDGDNLFVVLPSSKAVVDAQPDLIEIKKYPAGGLIISAAAPPGSGFDFFSRYFAPKFGIDEDPVCGSAHCSLAIYWSKKLGKSDLIAYAASRRSGIVKLHVDEQSNRVKLLGKAVIVMEGCVMV